MKWLAVLLVLTNVGAYLWIQRQGSIELDIDPGQYAGINLAQMSLKANESDQVAAQALDNEPITRIDLTEKAPKQLTFVAAKAIKEDATVLEPKREPLPDAPQQAATKQPQAAASTGNTQLESQVKSRRAVRFCYRIGPYVAKGALVNAVSVMETNAITHTVPKVSGERQIKAARVYLGPYVDPGVIDEMRAKLKQQRVEHYVVNNGGETLLQLGYFSSVKRGESYKTKLLKAGFDVKLEKIYQAKAGDIWIYFELDSEAKLRQLEQLKRYRAASIEKRNCA